MDYELMNFSELPCTHTQNGDLHSVRGKWVFRPKEQWKNILHSTNGRKKISRWQNLYKCFPPASPPFPVPLCLEKWHLFFFYDFSASQHGAASGGEVHRGRKKPLWCLAIHTFWCLNKKSEAFFQTSHNSGRTQRTMDQLNVEIRANQEEAPNVSWVKRE